jgi:hypothetical protein
MPSGVRREELVDHLETLKPAGRRKTGAQLTERVRVQTICRRDSSGVGPSRQRLRITRSSLALFDLPREPD